MSKILLLQNRAVLTISGPDSIKFLQSLITNDATLINEQNYIYSMFLTPQGRFLYDFFIIKRNHEILLDCQAVRKDEILKKLLSYKLRSQIEILPTNLKVYATSDGIAEESFKDPNCLALGWRTITEKVFTNTMDVLEYEMIRIKNLIADADKDFIYNKSFPLYYGTVGRNAINFNKGCYIGQEVTARMNYLGNLKNNLALIITHGQNPVLGEEIIINNKKYGTYLGNVNSQYSLALINKEENLTTSFTDDKYFSTFEVILTFH